MTSTGSHAYDDTSNAPIYSNNDTMSAICSPSSLPFSVDERSSHASEAASNSVRTGADTQSQPDGGPSQSQMNEVNPLSIAERFDDIGDQIKYVFKVFGRICYDVRAGSERRVLADEGITALKYVLDSMQPSHQFMFDSCYFTFVIKLPLCNLDEFHSLDVVMDRVSKYMNDTHARKSLNYEVYGMADIDLTRTRMERFAAMVHNNFITDSFFDRDVINCLLSHYKFRATNMIDLCVKFLQCQIPYNYNEPVPVPALLGVLTPKVDDADDELNDDNKTKSEIEVNSACNSVFDYNTGSTADPKLEIYLMIMDYMKSRGYKHKDGTVMERKYVRYNNRTHDTLTYVPLEKNCLIPELFSDICSANVRPQLRALLLRNKTFQKQLMDDLEKSNETVHFPRFEPCRHQFSFADGIYDCDTNKFYEYPAPPFLKPVNFFNVPFKSMYDEAMDRAQGNIMNVKVFRIKTVVLDHILLFQLCEDPKNPTAEEKKVYKFILALFGRIFYNIGYRDDWQLMVWLMGKASTGKTVIISIYRFIYGLFAGEISDTIEKQFGSVALLHKFICVMGEVTDKFQFPQSQWQSMVSGEPVEVPEKYRPQPHHIPKWEAPFISASNLWPEKWQDNSGSCTRRTAVISFHKDVSHSIPSLVAQLQSSVAAFIFKCNIAYLQVTKNAKLNVDDSINIWRNRIDELGTVVNDNVGIDGSNAFWEICPAYFWEGRSKMMNHYNTLSSFIDHSIANGTFERSTAANAYVPEEVFNKLYTKYRSDYNYRNVVRVTDPLFNATMTKLQFERVSANVPVTSVNMRGDTVTHQKRRIIIRGLLLTDTSILTSTSSICDYFNT